MKSPPRADEVGESPPRSFRHSSNRWLDFISDRFSVASGMEIEDKLLSDISPLLLSWATLVIFASLLMFKIPVEWGEPKEMRYGVLAGTIVVFLPQICGMGLLLCALWWIPVICGWVFVSTYQWKYDVQPFRTGLWLGVGGLTGMFMGAWAMSVYLSA